MGEQRPLAPSEAWRAVATCFLASFALLSRRRVHLPRQHVGERLRFADGTGARVYRETRLGSGLARRSPVGERPLPAAPLLKAAALAARDVPGLNGFWTDDHLTAGEGVHLGVAVSLRGGGLVTPTLHHAGALPLPG
ncbi:2-oxo acid dehydrogenase subunit E2 [Streptomyces sp. JHA26]|uniref:2-oxo acid dehydrogenase subunit E2 n=1 Tax=Streptomyces sp. JHA26 TaxID=1917143 RepID=UPI00209BA167|nr:2-oxo acid dehydrogenase subunit E2 [Streptomyces sp. JHA26]